MWTNLILKFCGVFLSCIFNFFLILPDFAQLRPLLFAKYLPNILPPCREEDLDKYIEEAKQMSRDLRTNPEFIW